MVGRSKVKRSSNNRKEPLLPETQQNVKASRESRRTDKCGACGRFLLHLIPVLGCLFILSTLLLLASTRKITEASISTCLADYEPKVDVLFLIFVGATFMYIATVMRNIQINVYHRRQKSENKCMWTLNLIAAFANCIAYVGFCLLALYDLDGPGNAPTIHLVGAYMYFSLSSLYGLLHAVLLCAQRQYPIWAKFIFLIIPLGIIASTVYYVQNMEGEDAAYEYEWLAVALAAILVGMMPILFCIDPCDDELFDFFCCVNKRGNKSRRSRQGTRTGVSREKEIQLT